MRIFNVDRYSQFVSATAIRGSDAGAPQGKKLQLHLPKCHARPSSATRDAAIIAAQVGLLGVISWAGHYVVALLHVPLPGNVAGLLMTFLLLLSGFLPLHWVERSADLLIRHLALFFLPLAVGFANLRGVITDHGAAIVLTLVASTAVGFVVTASVSELVASLFTPESAG